jgi:hypothetical protein
MSSASTVLPSAKVSTELSSAEVIRLPTGNRKRAATRTVGFTKTNVAKMRCASGEKEEFFWDASCRGFGMRALSSGRRSWIFQYRDEHKRTRRIALGDVSAVSLEAARAAARQHAATVTQGGNPSVQRKSTRRAASVLDTVNAYLCHVKTQQRRGERTGFAIPKEIVTPCLPHRVESASREHQSSYLYSANCS